MSSCPYSKQDAVTNLCRYDSAYCRPPGAPLRSFLTECLAGPLVGGDPKLIHRFCDLYEHARHSYRLPFLFWSICALCKFYIILLELFRAFGEVELQNFNNLLVELRTLVATNRCLFIANCISAMICKPDIPYASLRASKVIKYS